MLSTRRILPPTGSTDSPGIHLPHLAHSNDTHRHLIIIHVLCQVLAHLAQQVGDAFGAGYLEQIKDGRDSQNSSRTGRSAHVIEYVGRTE